MEKITHLILGAILDVTEMLKEPMVMVIAVAGGRFCVNNMFFKAL
jgi:hypothetical protein